MPRASKPTGTARHDPLHVQLGEDELHEKYGKVTRPGKRKKAKNNDDENDEVILDPKTSRRIFELAQDQQDELGQLEDEEDEEDTQTIPNSFGQPRQGHVSDEDEDLDGPEGVYDGSEAFQELQIDSGDMATLDSLLPANSEERKTLADIIFAKLDGHDTEDTGNRLPRHSTDRAPDPAEGLNPKVVEVYTKVGQLLQKYKSGPLPKAFKIVPSLPSWARILALTRPENWSPQATRAATRIFISNMKPPQARVYLEGVILDAVREDIRENGKLNVHYYETLIRGLYKPAAFFKGIIFPMLDSGCTLKEAAIIASVLAKVKVPLVHSSAAILRIANMDYSGPNSLFIRVLVDKKYALPYKVVDGLVFHFIRLSNTYKAKKGESEKLPVLWHQSLLVFVQRYAADLTPDQKDALLDVIRATPHPQIGPDVRRELVNSAVRGEPRLPAGDVEMMTV
ncbi:Bystin-domain-containing protein [Rickenella mellea]|uniref:Bystin-domain-containing protein n=1 Tax=Rickenella mellea TaxID=50990 RepID=A0A4R5XF15_9AGAM|nr:Bystin-domain-containing protein [Rickenella mellea]